MADQRNFARGVVAFSAFLVAVCAIVVTIKVMSTPALSVKPERVLDPTAVSRLVAANVTRNAAQARVSCPVSVVVVVKAKFICRVDDDTKTVRDVPITNTTTVQVTIVDDQGTLSIETLH